MKNHHQKKFLGTVVIGLQSLFCLVTAGNLSAQAISNNFRIFPSSTTQTEVFITVHPSNPDILFSTANTISFTPSFFLSEGIYVTTNFGFSWYGSDTCNGANVFFHGGDPGITIDKNGTFIITRLGRTPFYGLYSHFSTDMGLTWSNQKNISTDDLERAATISDVNTASLFYGRTYTTWVKFIPPYPIMTSFTTNGGSTWSAPKQVNNPPQRCAGGDISTNKQGHVFICWAGVTSVSPFSEVHVGVASSSNGGIDWNVKEKAFDVSGIQGVLSSKQNIRVNGLPRIAVDNSEGIRSGWIYIVTSEKNLSPAGNDPDIILRRSTDSGNTWSAGIRVNQDPVNTGKTQFFPAIHVDDNGGVNIIYYDDRNTTNDSSGVFLSRSTDGGDTWIDYEISDHNFKPAPIGGLGQGYQGDNIGLTSSRKILWPVWMDNSTGIYQVWSTKIDLTRLSINDEIQIEDFMLFQNYPNPINSSTRIEYSVSRSEKVKLKVYDLLGREIITLVDEVKPSGKYEIEFNASNLPSGVYLYSLTAGKFSSTKKLVVIK